MVVSGLLIGAGLGLGAVMVAYGAVARPRPLAEALARLNATADRTGEPVDRWAQVIRRLADRLDRDATQLSRLDTDLAVTGRTREQHVTRKLAGALAGLAAPIAIATVLALAGVGGPPTGVAVFSLALAIVGYLLPDTLARAAATRRRRSFRFALSSYLDLVTVLLAAGTGVETALLDATHAGHGWSFRQLRQALERSRLTGDSPWQSFQRLGDRLDLNELREVAASLQLAGSHGARVRASLQARAESLRSRDLIEMEAEADAATERMSVPSVLLVVGFILFVGFPAAHEILGF